LLAQARAYRPDVLYIGIMGGLPPEVARELVAVAPCAVAQIAAPIPRNVFRGYNLFLSSIPSYVERFRRNGARAAFVPLAFEPRVLDLVSGQARTVPVSFVGSVGPTHPARSALIGQIAKSTPIALWTDGPASFDARHQIKLNAGVYGRTMYEVLGRSQITLNIHAAWAGPDANNLRLYEATGMGALLVTDAKRNLGDLFAVGTEVVDYRDASEAADRIRYLVGNPAEASRIAAAGQARTLRDHTWAKRMSEVLDLLNNEPKLKGRALL
jgi:hypothetical protein